MRHFELTLPFHTLTMRLLSGEEDRLRRAPKPKLFEMDLTEIDIRFATEDSYLRSR